MIKPLQLLKRGALLAVALLLALFAWRVYDALRDPPLELWHTVVPHELSAARIDATDWKGYLDA